MNSYTHTSSTGRTVIVYFGEGFDRYHVVNGTRRMMLPYLPNSVHGRYFAEQLSTGRLDRRTYRRLHDDYMLPRTIGVIQFDVRHQTRRSAGFPIPGERMSRREWRGHQVQGVCRGECDRHGV